MSVYPKLVSFLRLAVVHLCRRNTSKLKSINYVSQYKVSVCCWNVRTLLDRNEVSRPERRTALVAKELARYHIDIAALSETRLSGEDHIMEVGSGYTFFWKGRPEGEKREGGVGFAIKSDLVKHLEHPIGVSDRIMTVRLPLPHNRYMTIVSVYAPTLASSEESKTAFFEDLRHSLSNIPSADKILLLGDFNARVGRDFDTWDALGKFGVGKMNSNGLLLLQLCTDLQLAICNTFFPQKLIHKVTWIHPRSKHGHVLDYIICRSRDLRDVCNVRVMRGAECGTDHMLVRGKLKVNIRRKNRSYGVSIPMRIDVSKLGDLQVRKDLENAFENVNFDGKWEQFKDTVYETSADVLGFRKRKHQDWFDDNSVEVDRLLKYRNDTYQKFLQASDRDKPLLLQSFKNAKALLQRHLRQMKKQWWLGISEQIQNAFDRKDSKSFYKLLSVVFGPRASSSVPLVSKDGNHILKDADGIMKRWTEHFGELFFNPSTIDTAIVNGISQRDVFHEMMDLPDMSEVHSAMQQVNTGKAPGLDGIPMEVLLCGGEKIEVEIHRLIVEVWTGGSVPQDWIDAILIALFKGKGSKSVCGDYRGISLLVAVGKVFVTVLVNRLIKFICPHVLSESQSGFRVGRGTMDMIFSARQLQEKCIEHQIALYQVFVDLTKAFDSVNREALWTVLGKLGCPYDFVRMFRDLHLNMKGRVNFHGTLSEPIAIENGVKQGDIAAPVLFAIYFAVTLCHAFEHCSVGVYLRVRSTGKVFDLRRFNARSKCFEIVIRDLLYADDADLVSHSQEDMQVIMNLFSKACTSFGLTINLKKTKVMYAPPPGQAYNEPDVFVNGQRLAVVDTFVYLGSTLSRDGSLDAEISYRVQKASVAFGLLESRVWADRGISRRAKIKVYEACVLTALLYSSETWTTYRRHIRVLERFHQGCLRRILGIKWQSCTPDTAVLESAETCSIEKLLVRNQMRWVGHVLRMGCERLPKQLLYGELTGRKRPNHKPRKRFKDVIKCNLKSLDITVKNWEQEAENRPNWRRLCHHACKTFEEKRIAHAKMQRALKKGDLTAVTQSHHVQLTCSICGRVCLSAAGFASHTRSHSQQNNHHFSCSQPLPHRPVGFLCQFCNRICKSTAGLKRHVGKMHNNKITLSADFATYVCHICKKACKNVAGLQSHLRAHGRRIHLFKSKKRWSSSAKK